MSVPRAFVSRLGSCRACPRAAIPRTSTTPILLQRSFTSTVRQGTDAHNQPTASESVDNSNAFPSSEPISSSSPSSIDALAEAAPATTSSPLPWYLQNRPAPVPQQAALIPDLPPNPPPLLPTLLDYLANTAGLDDLQLMDLRHLDPPPALGPKLIMLLCTARSEKHLHVSADRFCRWLRREHGLRANAAGLLGRNELKIKLRRKAKRMKMMANVGAAETEGSIDDGIRTGWICCTVGKIEAHEADTDMPGVDVEGFVGFSDVKPGVNVVIQMFTEEKRDEIDLERLWGGIVKTGDRKDRIADEMLREVEEVVDEAEAEAEAAAQSKQEEDAELDELERKLMRGGSTSSALPPTPKPNPHYTTPRPSLGDPFPDVDAFAKKQRRRRFHTVGLQL